MILDYAKIKLVIWDLDEVFWDGTLSDGNAVFIPENAALVKAMTDAGVINSICSKNDGQAVMQVLQDHQIADYFVFQSVNWSPKGARVKQIIDEMNLRAANVLFIDDNNTNLAEVGATCPGIMLAGADVIPHLVTYFSSAPKKDPQHDRLKQYKMLEKKRDFKSVVGSNESFLEQCNIVVQIGEDCANYLDRLSDLSMRSNQLNFTKSRLSKTDIAALLHDPSIKTGYVSVKDDFGEYGIVGFFALKEDCLLHFLFSCRTLNMGVEQYVYNLLQRPCINIVGEVSSDLNNPSDPYWINMTRHTNQQEKKKLSGGG